MESDRLVNVIHEARNEKERKIGRPGKIWMKILVKNSGDLKNRIELDSTDI